MLLPVPSLRGISSRPLFPRGLLLRGMVMLALSPVLAGCTSLHNPVVRSDLYETQVRATAALNGNDQAFERLGQLQQRWDRRAADNWYHRLMPWDRANRARSTTVVADIRRISGARDAVTSQRELAQVMANALRNIEDEYDAINENLQQGDGQQGGYSDDGGPEDGGQGSGLPAANLRALADQKYLARRMAGSLVLMSSPDMSQAIQASDQFGRDANRFRKLLDASVNGDAVLGITPADTPDLQDSLSQIDELFGGYIGDSSSDLLDNVVTRYDAWTALAELNALTPVTSGQKTAVAPAAQPAAQPVAPAEEPAAEDNGAADAPAAGAADNPADEGDMPADQSPEDDASGDPAI